MVSCIGPCRQITAHLEVASGDADLYAREDRAPVIEVGSWDGLGNDNLINLNTFKYNDKVSILALRGGNITLSLSLHFQNSNCSECPLCKARTSNLEDTCNNIATSNGDR